MSYLRLKKKENLASVSSYVIFKLCGLWLQPYLACKSSSPFIFLPKFLGVPGDSLKKSASPADARGSRSFHSLPALTTPVTAETAAMSPKSLPCTVTNCHTHAFLSQSVTTKTQCSQYLNYMIEIQLFQGSASASVS